jgi:rRNA maturation RNase YbeY
MPAEEMTRLNETFLHHRGVTDVITFDYAEGLTRGSIQGEIFVCLDEARIQARRFRTTWQDELVRYIVHGLLHLDGYDDHRKADRLRMKRRENELMRQLARKFPLEKLGNAAAAKRRVQSP